MKLTKEWCQLRAAEAHEQLQREADNGEPDAVTALSVAEECAFRLAALAIEYADAHSVWLTFVVTPLDHDSEWAVADYARTKERESAASTALLAYAREVTRDGAANRNDTTTGGDK